MGWPQIKRNRNEFNLNANTDPFCWWWPTEQTEN